MLYLALCAVLFGVLAIYRPSRIEWLTLCVVTVINFVLTCVLSNEDPMLYKLVPTITFVGAVVLCIPRTTLGFYHSIILLVTLVAYAALAYDVAHGMHILIYNNYEATIYGLVGCQLIAIFPTIRLAYRDHHSDIRAWLVNLQRVTRA